MQKLLKIKKGTAPDFFGYQLRQKKNVKKHLTLLLVLLDPIAAIDTVDH